MVCLYPRVGTLDSLSEKRIPPRNVKLKPKTHSIRAPNISRVLVSPADADSTTRVIPDSN